MAKRKKKVHLLLRKLGTTEHSRFVDFILPAKKTMDLEFSERVKLLSELFGPNTSLFHIDGNVSLYLRMTSKII